MQEKLESLSIKCCIDGCGRDAMYKRDKLCQKHYFRIMRNGHPRLLLTTEREKGVRSCKDHFITPNGYKRVYQPGHPLANGKYVFEHRKVIYEKYGNKLPNCELCGKEINWSNAHIDHIDENRLNNDERNLRALCRPCNTTRTPRSTITRYEYNGILMSVTELAKVEGVQVCRDSLKRRLKKGIPLMDALFMKNKTHPRY